MEGGEPVVNTLLKTPAAKRDVPIPKCLVACLKEEREKAESEYVISNSKGTVLTETQFVRVWKYITVRSTAERCYYTYVNGQSIKHRIKPRLGEHQPNNPKLVYTMDFKVTPHMLRHTYITNLIYKGVDPKTVQYLAGHENSKTTMDIYAKVKYNKPEELSSVVMLHSGCVKLHKNFAISWLYYGFTERGKPEKPHEYWPFWINVR